jgi:hypothetical protein
MKKHFFSFLFLLCLAPGVSYAAFSSDYAGAAGAQFLKLGPGARSYGMAEAFSASAADSSAIYWNPAGLAGVASRDASFTHAAMFEGINYEWLSYAFKTGFGGVGFGLQSLSYGDITARDTSGNATGSLNPGDFCLSAAGAEKDHVLKDLSLGISLKYISSKISERASAYAVDAGAKYELSEKTALSLVAQNFGSSLKYRELSDPIPFLLRLGLSHKPVPGLSLETDAVAPADGKAWFSAGAEYSREISKVLKGTLRAGYGTSMNDLGGSKDFALGLGLGYHGYSFDYAYTPSGDMGNTSRFSLSVAF